MRGDEPDEGYDDDEFDRDVETVEDGFEARISVPGCA
jgi:hypothetical protein